MPLIVHITLIILLQTTHTCLISWRDPPKQASPLSSLPKDVFVPNLAQQLPGTEPSASDAATEVISNKNVTTQATDVNQSLPSTSSRTPQGPCLPSPINDKYLFDICNSQEIVLDSEITQNVKGRLKENVSFWKNIGANPEILETIEHGYKIPFLEVPESSFSKNNKSAIENLDFVEETLSELQLNGCIKEVSSVPHVVNPLSVSINKQGKKRLILDLRKVNKLVWKDSFTFEDWKVGLEYFEKDAFCFKYDLSKGYYHIDIFEEHQTYLGFSVNGKYYVYTVLAFGLSSAPFIFTKLMREIVKYIRLQGIKLVMFLDDGWGTNKNFAQTLADSNFVQTCLSKAGFVLNQDKSIWTPVQTLEWIGLFWNSIDFSISIPDRRIVDTSNTIQSIFENLPFVSARRLAQCSGKIISMSAVFGNLTRLMTRYIYKEIETRKSWDYKYKLHLENPCLEELKFWLKNISVRNKRYLSSYTPLGKIVFSDASSIAAGSYIVDCKDSVFHSMWSDDEKSKSSTFREIRAVKLALRAYGENLKDQSVKWFSDSQACVQIIQVGSTNLELHEESRDIFDQCSKLNIDLKIQWIPRDLNQVADEISKTSCTDEWRVSDEFFSFIDEMWGPHDVDRFASFRNRKVHRFNSKFVDFQSEAVDAFTQSWSDCNNWLVPPIKLVPRVLAHLLFDKAAATLIVPKWPSSAFWPLIFKENYQARSFVSEVLEFHETHRIFEQPDAKKCMFDSGRFKSKVLAIRIEKI